MGKEMAEDALPELRVDMPTADSVVTEFTEVGDDEEASKSANGLTVTFQELEYTVNSNAQWRERVTLLTDISGSLYPRQLLALMGPSGSGKTTLLDLLAGRKTVGVMRGRILYAGQKPTRAFLRRHTGYVEQCDTLLGNLTVYEMLAYTAELKNPASEPLEQKAAKVEQVLQQLGLSDCRGVRIGSQLARGISGGQAKRANIGIALVTNPRVLYLDEPTSGLDSFTAAEVVAACAALAAGGITVCATVHSPSAACLRQFDRLMLLLGGRLVYAGPCGQPAVDYFLVAAPERAPRSGTVDRSNPAEWIMDLAARADRDGVCEALAAAYQRSSLRAANNERLRTDTAADGAAPAAALADLAVRSSTATPFASGLWTILKYRGRRDLTDPAFLAPRIMDKLAIALLIMTLYWGVGRPAPGAAGTARAVDITSALFMWTVMPGFAAAAYVPTLVEERPLFNRELSDGLYQPITYLAAKLLEEGVVVLLQSVALSLLVFYPLHLSGQWALFWFVYFLTTCIGVVLAYAIAALSPDIYIANAALPAYVVSLLFFVGLLLRPAGMPGYWRWYAYLDLLRYGWIAQMVNQFEHSHILIGFNVELLDFYSLRGLSKWAYAGMEATFLVGFLLLAWAALSFLRHTRR